MALAYLCSRLRLETPNIKIADNPLASFWAVTVNHGFREGSLQEAKAVAECMTKMGIKSTVLSIKLSILHPVWREALEGTPYTDPAELPNLETIGRRLRYQAIAKHFSKMSQVVTLLLAHHEDDQYETLLMRLMNGHAAPGLLGMRPAAEMPECQEVHGAYQSGFVDDQRTMDPVYNFRPNRSELKRIKSQLTRELDPELALEELAKGTLAGGYLEDVFDDYAVNKRPSWGLPATPLDVEDGGIMAYRPLLEFSKDRLIATCEANQVPWFEDATNSDPKLTSRNAIRHLYKHHTLPVALQKPAILEMSSRLVQKSDAAEVEVDRLLSRTIVRDFDSNAGTVVVRLPSFHIPRRHRRNKEGLERRMAHYRRLAALLVKRLIAIVTPELPGTISSDLRTTVLRLFPSLNDGPSTYTKHPKAFNIASVHFLPVWTSKKRCGRLNWYLTREPYVSGRLLPLLQYSGMPLPHRWRRRPEQWRWPDWRSFRLWDGRFWIRLVNRTCLTTCIMPFDINDAHAFRNSLPAGKQRDRLVALLKHHAPGKVRYTLPAIYTVGNFEDMLANYERVAQQEKASLLDEAEAKKEWEQMRKLHGEGVNEVANAWEKEMGLKAPPNYRETAFNWQEKYYGNPDRLMVGLPTLGIYRPGLQNWIRCEVRYKKVHRDLLDRCPKNENDLARYERTRARASKTGRRTWQERNNVKHKRRSTRRTGGTDEKSHRRHVRRYRSG